MFYENTLEWRYKLLSKIEKVENVNKFNPIQIKYNFNWINKCIYCVYIIKY